MNKEMSEYCESMYQLGNKINKTSGDKWFIKAAGLGHVESMFALGYIYKNAYNIKDKAAYWYEKAAKNGHVHAMFKIGECYQYGEGVDKNIKFAEQWYNSAANANHIGAVYKFANNGNINAIYKLANLYKKDKNEIEATKLYEKAAIAGHIDSMYIISQRYQIGLGLQKSDEKRAIEWCRIAAYNGHIEGTYHYGELFESKYKNNINDIDISNTAKMYAIELYTFAANKGHIKASIKLNELAKLNELSNKRQRII